jgi:uncharacterized protein YmfQ (DUF2313 family)
MPGFPRDRYREMLAALMPPGGAWRGPVLAELLDAAAGELARLDGRIADLLDREADPRAALELLAQWEAELALPGPCALPAETLALRRERAHDALTARGGASRAFFVGLAARLGYAISIEEFRPFRAGRNAAGESLYGEDWTWAWRVRVAAAETVRRFRAGASAAGEPLAAWGNDLLECVIGRVRPAHTRVLFGYGEA